MSQALDYVGADALDYLDADDVGALPQFGPQAVSAFVHAMKKRRAAKIRRKLSAFSKAGQIPSTNFVLDTGDGGAAAIAAGGVFNVNDRPSSDLRIIDFYVDQTFAADCLITQLRIGTLELINNTQGMIATAFAGGHFPPMEAPIASSGSPISIAGTNIGGAARRFLFVFWAIDLAKAQNILPAGLV